MNQFHLFLLFLKIKLYRIQNLLHYQNVFIQTLRTINQIKFVILI